MTPAQRETRMADHEATLRKLAANHEAKANQMGFRKDAR